MNFYWESVYANGLLKYESIHVTDGYQISNVQGTLLILECVWQGDMLYERWWLTLRL